MPVESGVGARPERRARWVVRISEIFFVLVLLADLDGPFVSAHNERQNQTFDMSRHVWRDGWSSVITPKVSYSGSGHEKQPYTAALQEVPFHGLLGWPLVKLFGHERAVARIISAAFALGAIELMFCILRCWLPPGAAAAGAAIWATAPLTLHFGQIPMPDIVCTTGMLTAFWFALRGNLPASSAGFLFAVLAKLSMIVFGLPILTALLVAKKCGSVKEFLRMALLWGWLPLCGLLSWEFILYHFAPPSDLTVGAIMRDRGSWDSLIKFNFYKFVVGCILPFGFGVLGAIAFLLAPASRRTMDGRVKWAIIGANLFFLVFVIRKVPELQYLVPVLAWFVMAAAFGFDFLLEKLSGGVMWRVALGTALALHLAIVFFFTVDLKATRVPAFADIERAAKLLPPDARVLVFYRYYGASPAVWLDRNVIAIGDKVPSDFPIGCRLTYDAGFTHLLILDIESWHDGKSNDGLAALFRRFFQALKKQPPQSGANLSGFANPNSVFRQYADLVFTPMLVTPHVVLYSMAGLPERAKLGEKIVWPAGR